MAPSSSSSSSAARKSPRKTAAPPRSPKLKMRANPWVSGGQIISKPRPRTQEDYEAWCRKFYKNDVFTRMGDEQRAAIKEHLVEWGAKNDWKFVVFRKAVASPAKRSSAETASPTKKAAKPTAKPTAKPAAKPTAKPAPKRRRHTSTSSSESQSSGSESERSD